MAIFFNVAVNNCILWGTLSHSVTEVLQLYTYRIHALPAETLSTRKLKFGMMIHNYLVNSFLYSKMPYDLDRNFQGHLYRV